MKVVIIHDWLVVLQLWVAANLVCVWDEDLIGAIKSLHYLGNLIGGYILIGGIPPVLATISHAHARALLNSPAGFYIYLLGKFIFLL